MFLPSERIKAANELIAAIADSGRQLLRGDIGPSFFKVEDNADPGIPSTPRLLWCPNQSDLSPALLVYALQRGALRDQFRHGSAMRDLVCRLGRWIRNGGNAGVSTLITRQVLGYDDEALSVVYGVARAHGFIPKAVAA